MRTALGFLAGAATPPEYNLLQYEVPEETRWLESWALRLWSNFQHNQLSLSAAHPDEHGHGDGQLFKREDFMHWVLFTVVFLFLVVFDSVVLHRKGGTLSVTTASLYCCFWITCAVIFGVWIFHSRGQDDAINWGIGYLLEYMLSVDNLFVFHRIFAVFHTPDDQKHKALFWGIAGAIFFRMVLFVAEQALMHNVWWMHWVFGAFLVYTGIRAGLDDGEEDEGTNMTDYPVFNKIAEYIHYVDEYDEQPRFFKNVVMENGETKLCGTRLLVVVLCLELTDVVFAVDSVSVIVAQIPDLYLSYTACIFAMLGLRAAFFVVDELVRMFAYLGYGVAVILIFIGVKLMLKQWVHIPPLAMLFVIVTTLMISILASVYLDKVKPGEASDSDDAEDPLDSPPPLVRRNSWPKSSRPIDTDLVVKGRSTPDPDNQRASSCPRIYHDKKKKSLTPPRSPRTSALSPRFGDSSPLTKKNVTFGPDANKPLVPKLPPLDRFQGDPDLK